MDTPLTRLYSRWQTPRRHQADPEFSGMVFARSLEEKGLLTKMCDLALQCWEDQNGCQPPEDESTEDESKEDKSKEDKSTEDKPNEDKSKEDKPTEDKPTEDKSKEDESTKDNPTKDESTKAESTKDKTAEDKSKIVSLIDGEPDMGKRNIVYRMRMPDGKIWVARLRDALRSREYFGEASENREIERKILESEVATMKYVKEKTTIPVPTIYEFNISYENPLGTPYMFMECMPGKPFPFPFDTRGGVTGEELVGINWQLADFQSQLLSLHFDQISQLYFDPEDNTKYTLGPIVDRNHRLYGPYTDAGKFLLERAEKVLKDESERPESIVSTGFKGKGGVDLETAHQHCAAAKILARPESGQFNSGPFVLQHVDMQVQNILLDESGNVVGIIDWEWAFIGPLECFPWDLYTHASRIMPYDEDFVKTINCHALNAMSHFLQKYKVAYKGFPLYRLAHDNDFRYRQEIGKCLEKYNTRRGRERDKDSLAILLNEDATDNLHLHDDGN